MNEVFEYNTVHNESLGKYQSRGSKFIAYLFPLSDLSDLDSWISKSRKDHPKARHHCYAYRILDNREVTEFASDDGEPGGSAGRPILNQLKSADLTNVACVVVRYFGGTKLGVPGLIEAYGTSAKEAVTSAHVQHVVRSYQRNMTSPIALQPHIHRAAKQFDVSISQEQYSSDGFSCLLDIPMETFSATLLNFLAALSSHDYATWEEHAEFLSIQIDEAD